MSELILGLLGGFEARTLDGAALSFPTKKTKALLAYLAAHPGKSHSRSDLANLLWGDSGEEQARSSLRQTLSYLRKSLAPTGRDHLVLEDDLVSIDPATVQVDVDTLESLAAQGEPEALERAGALYQGDFLKGFDLREEAFNDWLRAERVRHRELVTAALKALLAHHEAGNGLTAAVGVANQLLAIDPLQEQVHRRLMGLYLRRGERALAVKQYETCRELLLRELGVEPDDETKRVRQEACAATPGDGNEETAGYSELPLDGPKDVPEPSNLAALQRPESRGWMRPPAALATVVAVAALALAGVVAWVRPWASDVEPAAIERMAFPLPDKPSIAVLPFDNLSGDAEQAYFVDALTDNIVTELSRFSGLFVIAWTSSLTYKGKPVKVQQVAEDFGVRYVLKGSVHNADDRLRITTQLVDALTGNYVWAERYERDVSDIFVVQDEVTQEIVSRVGGYQGEVAEHATKQAMRKSPTELNAYEAFLIGVEHKHRWNKEDNAIAEKLIKKAIELDPQLARAYVALAWVYAHQFWFTWSDSPKRSLELALETAREAVALDPSDAEAHWVLADLLIATNNTAAAVSQYERALDLNSNNADLLADWGWNLAYMGRAKEGVEQIKKAMRLNPHHLEWYVRGLGDAAYTARQYEEAIAALKKVENHMHTSRLTLAASYAQLGRLAEARAEMAEAEKFDLDYKLENVGYLSTFPHKNSADQDHWRDGLRKAGLPE